MRVLALLVCLLVVLAGCGGPTGTTTPHETAGSTGQPTVTATEPIDTTRVPAGTTETLAPTTPFSRTERTVTVTEVVDGDTMDVRFANGTTETVRLLGVDTPEVHVENTPGEFEGIPATDAGEDWLHRWGETASAFARDELDDRRVTISFDPAADRRGSYGRLLVYIRVDGRPFNRRLLARGYARYYDAPLTRTARFESIEARARQGDTGLWDYAAA